MGPKWDQNGPKWSHGPTPTHSPNPYSPDPIASPFFLSFPPMLPELETELAVLVLWLCSICGLVEALLLVLVPSSLVFLKKLCWRA